MNILMQAKSAADRTKVLEAKISPSGGGLITIPSDHALIHAGKMFSVSGQVTGLAAGATAYFHGLTDGGAVHFRAGSVITTGAPCTIVLSEGADITANGTPVTAVNRNRASTNTPTLQVFTAPTIGGGGVGTPLETGLIPITGGGNAGGYADLFAAEWLLAAGTSYVISLTNNDTTPLTINYNFLWYEV